jgi:hypothetical protein
VTIRILQNNLWPTITKLAKNSQRTDVAVGYLGHGATKLLPLHKDDSLVIDMSQDSVRNGQTNPFEVEKYLKKRVDVYTCSNLHAKLYVFDTALIVGSANVSQHSQHGLIEVGLLCRNRDLLTQARGLIKSLQVEPVTPEYVKFCQRIYNPPKKPLGRSGKRKGNVPMYSPLWVVGVWPLDDDDLSEQEKQLDETERKKATKKLRYPRKYEINLVRWTGKSTFGRKVRKGDLVVQVFHEGKKKAVCPPSRVVHTKRYLTVDRGKTPRVLVYLEEPKSLPSLAWQTFKIKTARSGLRHISSNPEREIRSQESRHMILGLWN